MEKQQRAFFLLFALIFFSCASLSMKGDGEAEQAPFPAGEGEPLVSVDYVTIIAVGDNLCHDVIIRAGEQGDYEAIFSESRILAQKADISFINQETLLGGESFGFSGYPQFNSPQAMGRALVASGFNVVNHASNHIMDKGERAVFATMDFWDTMPDATVLGIHRSAEQRGRPTLITKNNITLGFLSYTYGTNGIAVPKDKPYLVSLINTEIMAKEIDALRPLCDFLVVSMHWGEEYEHEYSRNQATLAAFLAEHRVDLVIGHHPHVIQGVEKILRPDGKSMLCFYSLGNFISAHTLNPFPTLLGAMAYVKIEKQRSVETDAGVAVTEAGAIPLVTHIEKYFTGFKVYPLYAYTDELLGKHHRNQAKEITVDYFTNLAAKVLGDMEIKHNPFD